MPKLTIIYISSLGHSGSTLLDIMLGQHSQIQGVGEIMFYDDWINHDNKCTCGNPMSECLLWNSISLKEFSGLNSMNGPNYKNNSYELFNSINNFTRKKIIIDSSKSNERLKILLSDDRLDVKVIHLIRNGLGVVNSMNKSHEKLAFAQKNKTISTGVLKGTIRWIRRNLKLHRLMKKEGISDYLQIRYEDLCRNPAKELIKICSFINVDYEKKMKNPTLDHCHNISGSRWRFSDQPINIKLDEKWKVELSLFSKIIFQIWGSWLNRRYGY